MKATIKFKKGTTLVINNLISINYKNITVNDFKKFSFYPDLAYAFVSESDIYSVYGSEIEYIHFQKATD